MMDRPVLLLGSEGSMGKRYQAILRYLGQPFVGYDIVDPNHPPLGELLESADRIIIATPTPSHAPLIFSVLNPACPILCEKPLSTDLREVERILATPNPLRMMTQYAHLDPDTQGVTSYDYFRSGQDGLTWDCIQLIALARSRLRLDQTSPVWSCKLNGARLTLEDVEWAYVEAVEEWLTEPEQDREWLRRAHEKAAAWAAEHP